tara:strand:- start:5789 stop:6034 length:246 start_codon:yes stop_codon:yes gene_type:complete
MAAYLPLIIQLVSGAIGGNVAGKLSLGSLGNSIGSILGDGLGDRALMAVFWFYKKAMAKYIVSLELIKRGAFKPLFFMLQN